MRISNNLEMIVGMYDLKAKSYVQIMTSKPQNMLRGLAELANDKETIVAKYPQDFEAHLITLIDTTDGAIVFVGDSFPIAVYADNWVIDMDQLELELDNKIGGKNAA